MSLKSKKTLEAIKFRTGDLVKEGRQYGIVLEINAWWQLEHLIDVQFVGKDVQSLVNPVDLKLVKSREAIKEWWLLFTVQGFKEFSKKYLKKKKKSA